MPVNEEWMKNMQLRNFLRFIMIDIANASTPSMQQYHAIVDKVTVRRDARRASI